MRLTLVYATIALAVFYGSVLPSALAVAPARPVAKTKTVRGTKSAAITKLAAKPAAKPTVKPTVKPVGPPAAKAAAPALSKAAAKSAKPDPLLKAKPAANARAERTPGRRDSSSDEIPVPPDDDRDRERIRRMQDTIGQILHNRTLGRLKVGLRVVSARTGRLYYGRRDETLMDPASNQKVLATTAALMRLGADWRFRTEVSGPAPDGDGVVSGNLYLRGSSDPALRTADIEALAARLRSRGITRVDGGVVADPRRIGDDGRSDDGSGEKAPLIVDSGLTLVRVRPGANVGDPAVVITSPAALPGEDARSGFVVRNQCVTSAVGRRAKASVRVTVTDGRVRIEVSGKLPVDSSGVSFRRKVPRSALHAAVVLRSALVAAGIPVRDAASTGPESASSGFVEVHRSPPLSVVLRKINKDSNNDWAERVLLAVGAEERGGGTSTDKGLAVLRAVLGDMGLRPGSYVPKNGSGLGHANRITPHAMADLLRQLYFDPRVGPEILQSLSVGGIDGTTRNRFKGTLAAKRVRAKTGTLNGKSCLSGLVGDGDDVLVFSMMVQGFRGRNLRAVRASQVGAVTALMRYVREGSGERIDLPSGFDEELTGSDFEVGGEATESGAEGEGDHSPLSSDIMPLAGEPVRPITPGRGETTPGRGQSGAAPARQTTPGRGEKTTPGRGETPPSQTTPGRGETPPSQTTPGRGETPAPSGPTAPPPFTGGNR